MNAQDNLSKNAYILSFRSVKKFLAYIAEFNFTTLHEKRQDNFFILKMKEPIVVSENDL